MSKLHVTVFQILLGVPLGVELLGHMVTLRLTLGDRHRVFQSSRAIQHSHGNPGEVQVACIFSSTRCCPPSLFDHPSGCEVASRCGLDFHLSKN